MKILGAGLSRTGTNSLTKALQILGYNTIHWEPKRLRDVVLGKNTEPDWRRYDDVDAVTDIPAAIFYRELLSAYPDAKCILTVRDVKKWYASMVFHYRERVAKSLRGVMAEEAKRCQELAYGSREVTEYIYCKKYREHNEAVQTFVPAHRLLVLDLESNNHWPALCAFLDKPIPNEPYPFITNRG